MYIIPCIHPEKKHAFFYYVNGVLLIHEAFEILACLIRQEIYFVAEKESIASSKQIQWRGGENCANLIPIRNQSLEVFESLTYSLSSNLWGETKEAVHK